MCAKRTVTNPRSINFTNKSIMEIPVTISAFRSGIVMVFVPSLTSFAISQVLGGGHVLLIGNVIEQDFMQGMQWNAGSGLSFVLMIFVIVSMTIVNIFDKEGEGTSIC